MEKKEKNNGGIHCIPLLFQAEGGFVFLISTALPQHTDVAGRCWKTWYTAY